MVSGGTMTKLTKTDELKIVSRYLGSVTLLRSFAKQTDLALLETAAKNVQIVFSEQKEAEELAILEREDFENRRQAMLQKLQEEGWDLDMLMHGMKANKKPKKAPYKYSYVNSKGKTQFWSGFGRMPEELKMLVEGGKPLETFLIEQSTNV